MFANSAAEEPAALSESNDSQPNPALARFVRWTAVCCLVSMPVIGQEEASKPAAGNQATTPAAQDGNETKAGTSGQDSGDSNPPKPDSKSKTSPTPTKKQVVYDLLKPPIESTWRLFAAEKGVKLADAWVVEGEGEERKLVCKGKQKGYLRTQASYKNYKLKFDFRFLTDNGNSGILIHVDGKDKIWPDAVQVQLHRPTAGSINPSGNRKTRFTVGAKLDWVPQKWNTCVIDVQNDTVEVSINGLAVGPLKYCDPCEGFIALQSEGSEVHFRKLTLEREEIVKPKAPSVPATTEKTTSPKPPAKQPSEQKTDGT